MSPLTTQRFSGIEGVDRNVDRHRGGSLAFGLVNDRVQTILTSFDPGSQFTCSQRITHSLHSVLKGCPCSRFDHSGCVNRFQFDNVYFSLG